MTHDYWPDVADEYRKLGRRWPGVRQADRKALIEAIVRVEDAYELSRSQPKQAVRLELRDRRRTLEVGEYP